ncbi:MAG: aminoacyl-tRNA hydrolase [Candidatus Delongbacteria bacterium]|nr:aminoacyl-tRNA hydrolase [Candidatus Delongbacteria bacterium]MBN2835027.1 aminoacyl-tRNA hydrolase [Candidatus Delongbacteria bacterium]
MFVIVGLGNPGKKYEYTWHNLGFMVVDKFAQEHGISFKAGKGEFVSGSGFICSNKITIIKPTTYMNNSGRAVIQALKYTESDISDLLIVYDDIHIDFGTLRFRENGSAGGHNGVKSIIANLNSQNFNRLRLGFKTEQINFVLEKNPEILPDIVLSKIPNALKEEVHLQIDRAVDGIIHLIEKGMTRTMNYYNTN